MMETQTALLQNPAPAPGPAGRPEPLRAAPAQAPDVFGEVLEFVHIKSEVGGPWTFAAPWGIGAASGPPRFYILAEGKCWLEMDGAKTPVCLVRGDLVVITQGQGHCLRDPLNGPVVPLEHALASPRLAAPAVGQGNPPATTLIAGSLFFEDHDYPPLVSTLPPLLHIKGENGKALPCLDELLRIILFESGMAQPGSRTILNCLAQILFTQAIRAHLATLPRTQNNILAGLMDPEIGPALRLMHLHPEKPWTVATLAERVCMSRSAFAVRFATLVGYPPLHYLFLCRMTKASHLLRDPHRGIKDIAPRVGYASEAAFSNAFKRWTGTAPGNYRVAFRQP